MSSVPQGRKPKPRDGSRREFVLHTAVEMFSASPYEDVSVDDVCERAGVSHGLLFYYFGGKRGLFVAAVRQAWDELVCWERPRNDEHTATERVHGYVRRHFEYARRYPKRFSTLMRTGHADAEVLALVTQARENALAEIRSSLGCPQNPPGELRAAIWAWVGYMDQLTLEWLKDPSLSLDFVTDLCVQSLVSSVRAANGFRYDAAAEFAAIGQVATEAPESPGPRRRRRPDPVPAAQHSTASHPGIASAR